MKQIGWLSVLSSASKRQQHATCRNRNCNTKEQTAKLAKVVGGSLGYLPSGSGSGYGEGRFSASRSVVQAGRKRLRCVTSYLDQSALSFVWYQRHVRPPGSYLSRAASMASEREDQITHGELSQAYLDRTDEWYEPHGSWDVPLGGLNVTLHAVRCPPLSAVVILDKDDREPGGGFWGSAPSIPARPTNDIYRITEYGRILGQVHRSRPVWPATF